MVVEIDIRTGGNLVIVIKEHVPQSFPLPAKGEDKMAELFKMLRKAKSILDSIDVGTEPVSTK